MPRQPTNPTFILFKPLHLPFVLRLVRIDSPATEIEYETYHVNEASHNFHHGMLGCRGFWRAWVKAHPCRETIVGLFALRPEA